MKTKMEYRKPEIEIHYFGEDVIVTSGEVKAARHGGAETQVHTFNATDWEAELPTE